MEKSFLAYRSISSIRIIDGIKPVILITDTVCLTKMVRSTFYTCINNCNMKTLGIQISQMLKNRADDANMVQSDASSLMQLFDPACALIHASVDSCRHRQRAPNHGTYASEEAEEGLGTIFAVDDFHRRDIL